MAGTVAGVWALCAKDAGMLNQFPPLLLADALNVTAEGVLKTENVCGDGVGSP